MILALYSSSILLILATQVHQFSASSLDFPQQKQHEALDSSSEAAFARLVPRFVEKSQRTRANVDDDVQQQMLLYHRTRSRSLMRKRGDTQNTGYRHKPSDKTHQKHQHRKQENATTKATTIEEDKSRLCYCNYGPLICDHSPNACLKHPQAACFHAVRQEYNAKSRSMQIVHLYGCAPLEKELIRRPSAGGSFSPVRSASEASLMTCASGKVPHATPAALVCCYEGNFCNREKPDEEGSSSNSSARLTLPHFDRQIFNDGKNDTFLAPLEGPNGTLEVVTAVAFLGVGCLLGVALLAAALFCYEKAQRKNRLPGWLKGLQQQKQRKQSQTASGGPLLGGVGKQPLEPNEQQLACYSVVDPCLSETIGSGSGSGAMLMNQRTIAMDLTMLEVVARGRYGEVRKAIYRGTIVAVKTFIPTEEESWRNERDIYQTQMLNHENILQYVAADISSNLDQLTQMMLITDYHALGSLYDYLRGNSELLSVAEALDLTLSTISGIEHLHNPLQGTGGRRKPEIAHRDLKSKNVIVKRRGVCCIADFGLAISCEQRHQMTTFVTAPNHPQPLRQQPINIQVGTKRYMAPEVLARTLNPTNFDEFKQADIYSFSLVFWEILYRTSLYSTPNPDEKMMKKAEHDIDTGSTISSGGSIENPNNVIIEDCVNECSDSSIENGSMKVPSATTIVKNTYQGKNERQQNFRRSHQQHGRSSSSGFATGGGTTTTTNGTTKAGETGIGDGGARGGSTSANPPLKPAVKRNYWINKNHGELQYITTGEEDTGITGSRENQYQQGDSRPYKHPYEGMVDNDPSIEQMRQAVCEQRLRPPLPPLYSSPLFSSMGILPEEIVSSQSSSSWFPIGSKCSELMAECWAESGRSRHTALKVKKELLALVSQLQKQHNKVEKD